MRKDFFILSVPFLLVLAAAGVVAVSDLKVPVARGVYVGLILALAQTFLSIGFMRWAWKKKFFYYVWGGGILFRLFVFAGTAFVVYKYTGLSLAATLLSLVTATTLFLTFESATYLKKQ